VIKTFIYFLVRPKRWFRNSATDEGWSANTRAFTLEKLELKEDE